MKTRNLICTLLLAVVFTGNALAQDEEPVVDDLDQAQADELTRQEEGQVSEVDDGRISIGLLDEFGRNVEDADNKFGKWIRGKIKFSEIYMPEDVKDIPIFLRGFLANRSDMRMAEAGQDKLQVLADEFTMSEEGNTEFMGDKETGDWAGIDVFVRGRFTLNASNGNEIRADISLPDDNNVYQATIARTQYQAPVTVARKLSNNIADIIKATGPDERQLLEQIQKHKAIVDVANQSYEVNMIILVAGTAATTAGVLGILTKRYLMATVGISYGSLAWAGWFLQHSVGAKDRKAYKEKTALYNQKYGEKYVGDKKGKD